MPTATSWQKQRVPGLATAGMKRDRRNPSLNWSVRRPEKTHGSAGHERYYRSPEAAESAGRIQAYAICARKAEGVARAVNEQYPGIIRRPKYARCRQGTIPFSHHCSAENPTVHL